MTTTVYDQAIDVRVEVSGIPKPQPRPRAFAREVGKDASGKPVYRARIHEAGTAEAWKSQVIAALEAHRPETPIEIPVRVDIDFFFKRPKRLMRQKDPDGPVWCDAAADRDNMDKAVLDAMQIVGWFRNDKQVVCGEPRKFYHAKNGRTGAVIRVRAPAGAIVLL